MIYSLLYFVHPTTLYVSRAECCILKYFNDIRNLKFKPSKQSNLTSDKTAAQVNFRKRDNIVIKPTEKGGAVVVWERQLYIDEACKNLTKSLLIISKSVKQEQKKIFFIDWYVTCHNQTINQALAKTTYILLTTQDPHAQ